MISVLLRVAVCCLGLQLLMSSAEAQALDGADEPAITQFRGDLHLVQYDGQYSVLLVTSDGIILGDPISLAAAQWLKEELATLFPGRPVRYVLHSHHHFDRVEGAAVFNDTAELVGHRNFNAELSSASRSVPLWLADLDRNRNGKLERLELANSPTFAQLITKDRNRDGVVTPSELYSIVHAVEGDYESQRRITLGGKSVELVYPGPAHAADMTLLYFPSERVLFAVDPPGVISAPFSFGPVKPRDALRWIRTVVSLGFDTMVTERGERVARNDLIALEKYLDALVSEVSAGYAAGLTLAEVQASPVLNAYRTAPPFAARASQIADVYNNTHVVQMDISGLAILNYTSTSGPYCRTYSECTMGGAVPGGAAGATLLINRQLGIRFEVELPKQSWNSRTSPIYDDELAFRQSRGSLLFRYSSAPAGKWSVAFLGGWTSIIGDTRGMSRVKGRLLPVGGRHPIGAKTVKQGFTIGADIVNPIGDRLSIDIPLRLTRASGPLPDTWPNRSHLTVGMGLTMRMFRKIN